MLLLGGAMGRRRPGAAGWGAALLAVLLAWSEPAAAGRAVAGRAAAGASAGRAGSARSQAAPARRARASARRPPRPRAPGARLGEPRASSAAARRATLRAQLPPHVRELTGTRAASDGPNCLNAVSLWHGLTTRQEWTSWRVLDRHLQDRRQFRQLRAGEEPRFGDVIVYRHGPGDLIEHGSIFLDRSTVWEKASDSRSSPWRITSLRSSARDYAGHTVVEYYRRVDRGPNLR